MSILRGDHGKIYLYKDQNRGHWRARFQYKTSESDKVKTLTATGATKGKAETNLKRKWNEVRTSWARGSAEAERLTVKALLDHWFPTVKQPQRQGKNELSARTIGEYSDIAERALVPHLGERTLAELTPFMIEEALWSMVDSSGKGKSNAQRSITILKKALTFARKNAWMEKNPLDDVDTDGLYFTTKEPDALSPDEVNSVRGALKNWAIPSAERTGPTSTYVPDVFEFLVGTGCRISEALGLHWEDVHLDDEVPWVRIHRAVKEPHRKGKLWIGPTKTEDTRELEIPQFLVDVLRKRHQNNHTEQSLVFTTRNGNLVRRQTVARAMQSAMKQQGLDKSLRERVTHHAFRRTVATHLRGERAQRQLGHSSQVITERHYIAPDKSRISHGELLQALGEPTDETGTSSSDDQESGASPNSEEGPHAADG